MDIEWSTHTCKYYCTQDVHAFDFIGDEVSTPAMLYEDLINSFAVPPEDIITIREVPEALERWKQEAHKDEWVLQEFEPDLGRHAYLVLIRVEKPE